MVKKTYRDEIWESAISKITQKYDTKTDIIKIIYSVLYVLLLILILVGLGMWNKSEFIPAFMWGLFGADLFTILATKFATPIMAYFSMWNVAAERDKEQKERIEELSSHNDKIFIKKFDYYDPSSPSKHKVGIVIQNKNSIPFTDVSIELIETNWEKLDSHGNIYLAERIGVLADNSHFKTWANGTKNSIAPKDKETVYFFQIENGDAVALLENRKETFGHIIPQKEDEAISYLEIVFEVRGRVDDDFFDKRYRQRIKYISSKIVADPHDSIKLIRIRDHHSIIVCDSDIVEIVEKPTS